MWRSGKSVIITLEFQSCRTYLRLFCDTGRASQRCRTVIATGVSIYSFYASDSLITPSSSEYVEPSEARQDYVNNRSCWRHQAIEGECESARDTQRFETAQLEQGNQSTDDYPVEKRTVPIISYHSIIRSKLRLNFQI
jgi:hypothetical protein